MVTAGRASWRNGVGELMQRHVSSVALAAVLVGAAALASGRAAGASPVGASGVGPGASASARIAALTSKPWGRWSEPGGRSSASAGSGASGRVGAASESSGLRDPLGDEVDISGQPVDQPRADLVSASAQDTGTTVTFTAATAILSNPFTDPHGGR